MDWQQIALIAAGIVGATTAAIHGVLMQRFMVAPFSAALTEQGRTSAPLLRLLPVLMHFSTFAWLVSGFALIYAAIYAGPDTRIAISLGVGTLYAFGIFGNAWATRGRHPGWMLLSLSCALIVAGLA